MAYWKDNADSWVCSNCGYESSYQKRTCPGCGELMAVASLKNEKKELDEKYTKPVYYADRKYEPKDVIAALNLNFFMGNVVKYIARAGKKEGNSPVDDVSKAIMYCKFELDRLDQRTSIPKLVDDNSFFRSWEYAVIEDWGFKGTICAKIFENICNYATTGNIQEAASYVSSVTKDLRTWLDTLEEVRKKTVTPYTKEWAKGFNAGLEDVIEYINSTANTMAGTSILIPRSEVIGHCKSSKIETNTSLSKP